MPTFDVFIEETVTYKITVMAESEEEIQEMYEKGMFEPTEDNIWDINCNDITMISQWKEYEESN